MFRPAMLGLDGRRFSSGLSHLDVTRLHDPPSLEKLRKRRLVLQIWCTKIWTKELEGSWMTHIPRGWTSHKKLSKTQLKVVKRSINCVTTIVGIFLCKRMILFGSEIWNFEKNSEFFCHRQKFLTYSNMAKLYLVQKSDLKFNKP